MQQKAISRIAMVQRLYRRVLKLHKELPLEMRALGNEYARDEFRRNRDANQIQAHAFLTEWKSYCDTLENQLLSNAKSLGRDLDIKELDGYSQDQLGQLYSLQQEILNPKETKED